MIGDDVQITVVDIRGDKVRLGISAPDHISVHRKEVYDAIQRENHQAAQVRPEDLPGTPPSPPAPAAAPPLAAQISPGPPRRALRTSPTTGAAAPPAAKAG
jgi:carbon storage regulator